jgi:hypothetical protein
MSPHHQRCNRCVSLKTTVPPRGWRLHLLCRRCSDQPSVAQQPPSPPPPHEEEKAAFDLTDWEVAGTETGTSGEGWRARGVAMGISPPAFAALQISLRRVWTLVGRAGWRRAFGICPPPSRSARRGGASSPPPRLPKTRPNPGSRPEPELEPAPSCEHRGPSQGEQQTAIHFRAFADTARVSLSPAELPDEALAQMWLMMGLRADGRLSWDALGTCVRACVRHPRAPGVDGPLAIAHPDAAAGPSWAPGQRVFVPGRGMGTVSDLGRMAGDVQVALDQQQLTPASPKNNGVERVWRLRTDLLRVASETERPMVSATGPEAAELLGLLRGAAAGRRETGRKDDGDSCTAQPQPQRQRRGRRQLHATSPVPRSTPDGTGEGHGGRISRMNTVYSRRRRRALPQLHSRRSPLHRPPSDSHGGRGRTRLGFCRPRGGREEIERQVSPAAENAGRGSGSRALGTQPASPVRHIWLAPVATTTTSAQRGSIGTAELMRRVDDLERRHREMHGIDEMMIT